MKQLLISATLASLLVVASPLQAACNDNMSQTKPDAALRDNGDGTITDRETGLMWMKCSQGLSDLGCGTGSATSYTWAGALAAVQAANTAVTNGYSDWRLPSVAELGSLVESACYNPAVNGSYFPATVASSYWSSSPFVKSINGVWAVDFLEGKDATETKDSSNYVRLVR